MNKILMIILCAAMGLASPMLLFGTASADTTIRAVWPDDEALRQAAKRSIVRDASKPYVTRVGPVVFAADVFLPLSRERGKRQASVVSFLNVPLSVAFFSDLEYLINIDSDSRLGPDAMALGGRLAGHDLSSFTLTVTGESYLITLQDMSSAMLYRVVGKTETGLGTVTEIDLTRTPPIQYLPPIVPAP